MSLKNPVTPPGIDPGTVGLSSAAHKPLRRSMDPDFTRNEQKITVQSR